jgi:hypothetical protein
MGLDTAIDLLDFENEIRIIRLQIRSLVDVPDEDKQTICQHLDTAGQVLLWAVARPEQEEDKS